MQRVCTAMCARCKACSASGAVQSSECAMCTVLRWTLRSVQARGAQCAIFPYLAPSILHCSLCTLCTLALRVVRFMQCAPYNAHSAHSACCVLHIARCAPDDYAFCTWKTVPCTLHNTLNLYEHLKVSNSPGSVLEDRAFFYLFSVLKWPCLKAFWEVVPSQKGLRQLKRACHHLLEHPKPAVSFGKTRPLLSLCRTLFGPSASLCLGVCVS